MKKRIAVTVSIFAVLSCIHASAAEADKISVSDSLSCVKHSPLVSSLSQTERAVLEGLLSSDTTACPFEGWDIPSLKELLSGLFGSQKPDTGLPDDSEAPEAPEMPDAPGESETPENPDDSEDSDDSEDPDLTYGSSAQAVLALVNRYRAQNGLAPLALDKSLCKAAETRAREIVTSFSHTRPNGASCFTVLSESGIAYANAGENIAYGQDSANEVMNAWMNSSGHRSNILSSAFGHLGVGVYQSGGTLYWAQLFTD